ncbi:MAG: hypothetical protein J6S21_01865 [Victivallales bacterium]|nr:hypothetical protein [Victivallales bacterium]
MLIKIFAAVMLALAAAGCTVTAPDRNPSGNLPAESLAAPAPQLWITYLPYPDLEFMAQANVRPVPAYTGWTALRMERDAAMMKYAGIGAVLIKAAPAELADTSFQERCREFGRILHSAGGPRIALLLHPGANRNITLRRDNLLRYLAGIGYHGWEGILMHRNLPAILVASEISLTGTDPDNAPVRILHEGTDFPQRPAGAVTRESTITILDGFTRIRAGEADGSTDFSASAQKNTWPLPRLNGDALRMQLKMSRSVPALQTIILDSWNDYRDGSHVEPDTITRTRFVEILNREVPQNIP